MAAGLIIWQGAWMAIFALASPTTTKVSITEPVGSDVAIAQNMQPSPVKLSEKGKRVAQAMLHPHPTILPPPVIVGLLSNPYLPPGFANSGSLA